jgi:hypothetical protein
MKRIALFLALLSAGPLSANAQNDTIWRKGGLLSLAFNQVSLSNWSAGGDNSIGGSAMANVFAKMKKGKWSWDNNLELAFGAAKVGDLDWRNSDDKIDLNSKVGHEMGKNIYLTYLFGFKTQFTEGFDYPNDTTKVRISNFMTPAYILNALGFDWKPNESLSLFLSPLTAKTTLVQDQTLVDANAAADIPLFGVDPGKKSRNEFGAYFQGRFSKKLMENVLFATRLELFSNYAHDPQNVDVNWEVLLSLKVNKYISVLVNTQLLYDNDVFIPKSDANQPPGPGTQFKESLGIGFSYKLEGYTVR